MAPKIRPQKFPTPNLPDLVTIVDPETYYEAQFYFQQFGIVLVNLSTGEKINGQVNLSEIGMIIPDPNPKPKKPFGFVLPHESQEITSKFTRQNVDAILGRENIEQEAGQPQQITIQVVDHSYLLSWAELARKVASIMTERSTRALTPRVVFGITSLCSPNEDDDNNSTKETILSQIQGYRTDGDTYIITGIGPSTEIGYFDEDEEEFDE